MRLHGKKRKHDFDEDKDEDLPPGPSCIEEFLAWPSEFKENATEEEKHRILHLLMNRIWTIGDYSGAASEMEALGRPLKELVQHCGWHGLLPDDYLRHCRVCDCGREPLNVLTALAQKEAAHNMCVFSNLLYHMEPVAYAYLQRRIAEIPEHAHPDDRADKFEEIEKWIRINRDWIYDKDRKVPCSSHHKECPVSPLMDPTVDYNNDNDEFHVRPTVVVTGGVTCNAWSRQNQKRSRYSHDSELPHASFMHERVVRAKQLLEDVVFVECVVGYDKENKFHLPLAETHHSIGTGINPKQRGDAHRISCFLFFHSRTAYVKQKYYTCAWTPNKVFQR